MHSAVRLLVAASAGSLLGVLPAQAANDPGAAQQWNMPIVGAETAWSTGTGKGITIAIVDSGVDFGHEDLTGRVLPGRNFVTAGSSAQDDNGHGTHVAGIAAAAANNRKGVIGVAPEATILPVKVFDKDGATGDTSIYDGIRWAADNGAQVINLSLSIALRTRFVSVPVSDVELSRAVRYAWGKGVICVLSSGNDGSIASAFADEPGMVVTATDPDDRLAPYANDVGAAKWGMAAPGGKGGDPDEDDILSTYWVASPPNQYAWAAGTSMAAPHVAGAVAVLRGLGLSPQAAVDRVLTTAKPLSESLGWGRLDVAKAVAGLAPAGGGGGGSSGGPAATTTTTAKKAGSTSGGRSGSPSTAPAGGTTATTSTSGDEPRVGASEDGEQPATDGGDGVLLEELKPNDEAAAPDDDNKGDDNDPVWPLGLPAAAGLGAAAWSAVRLRRRRV